MFLFKKTVPLALVLLIAGCTTDTKTPDTQKAYFDIRGFFDKEAGRLEKKNPPVEKTVTQNEISEKKTVTIADWRNELELFSESDINKPALKQSYLAEKKNGETGYTSTDSNLRTRKIIVQTYPDGGVRSVRIENMTENILYRSTEHLTYYPDSLYRIEKFQHIKIIGSHHYTIVGKLLSSGRRP